MASAGSGAADWARSITVRSVSSWPTSRPKSPSWWTGNSTCPGSGLDSRKRRRATHVPQDIRFRESWRIGLDLIERAQADPPFGWITGDDEFGRVMALRAQLRRRQRRYVLDVPCDTLVRDINEAAPAGKRCPPWRRVDDGAKTQPASRWHKVQRGDGSKGAKVVRAAEAWVQTKGEQGRCGPLERLVVVRAVDGQPRTGYTLSNAPAWEPLERVVGVQGRRHGVEEALEAAKGEVGLGHYEVRNWEGWHHHMTLSLLAGWFLALEKRRLGEKNPGVDGAATAGGIRAAAPAGTTQCAADRGRGQSRLTA